MCFNLRHLFFIWVVKYLCTMLRFFFWTQHRFSLTILWGFVKVPIRGMYKSLTKIQIDNSVLSHHIISRAAGLASQGRIIPHVHKTDLFGVLTFTKLLFLLSCLSVCFTFLDSSPSIKGDNMWSTCTNTHWVQGLFWLLQRSVTGTQLSDQGASHLLKETEMLIIHLIMAICSKCLEKATKKNGSVAQEEISSNCRRGSWREVFEPVFEGWRVGDTHS